MWHRDIQIDALAGTGFFPHLGGGLLTPDLLYFPDVAIMWQRLLLLFLDMFSEDVHKFFAYWHITLGQQNLQCGVDQVEMDGRVLQAFRCWHELRLES